MNPIVADGFIKSQAKFIEQEVDYALTCAAKYFPDKRLTYDGLVLCTPEEYYWEMTKRSNTYNLAYNSVSLYKVLYSLDGIPIRTKYILLPFPDQDGCITLNDVRYYAMPGMTDPIISITPDGAFIPLRQLPLKINKSFHPIRVNGYMETRHVLWSAMHHRYKPKADAAIHTSLPHYLFARYGVKQTFKRFAKCDVEVCETYDPKRHPLTKWTVYSSCQQSRAKLSKNYAYIPTELYIAVPKDQATELTTLLAAGFFYIVDYFPKEVNTNNVNNTVLWEVLLGRIIFTGVNPGQALKQVQLHMETNDTLIDDLSETELKSSGVECSTIYELFINMMEHLPKRVLEHNVSSLYGKRLNLLRYLLADVVHNIFKLRFKLATHGNQKLDARKIESMMQRHLKMTSILGINKTNTAKRHNELTVLSTPSESKIHGMTGQVLPQTKSVRGGAASSDDPSYLIHASIAEYCSYCRISGSDQTGRGYVNMYIDVDEHGNITPDPNPAKRKLLARVQRQIETGK